MIHRKVALHAIWILAAAVFLCAPARAPLAAGPSGGCRFEVRVSPESDDSTLEVGLEKRASGRPLENISHHPNHVASNRPAERAPWFGLILSDTSAPWRALTAPEGRARSGSEPAACRRRGLDAAAARR